MHTLATCPIPTPARVSLAALGDFPASATTSEYLSLTAQSVKLALPPGLLAVEASAQADSSDQTFIGYSERQNERLDFVLWPGGSACDLFGSGSYPDTLGGEAFGYASTSGLVMVAGSNQSMSPGVVGARTFDTRTGEDRIVDPRERAVLSEPRAFATVSDFGKKVLVAGGENSIFSPAPLSDTAEVFDPTLTSPGFEPTLVKLAVPRSQHAAVNLESGEVALVGGRAPNTNASAFVEVVTPSTRGSTRVDNLWLARNAPVALRLADGRVFIAGGTDEDGHPVAGLEWRDVDATSRLNAPFDGSVELPARFDRAFAALPGGAVLAVGGCEDRPSTADEDCSELCAHGCPPTADGASGQRFDAFWIAPDGAVSALDFPFAAGRPVLLPGADGRPWLIASGNDERGSPSARERALYRFNPWQGVFERVPIDLGLGDALDTPRFVATGPDAFTWLDTRAQGPMLHGVRLGTRSVFSSDLALVQERDQDDHTRPAHLAPDHGPSSLLSYDSALGTLEFAESDAGVAPACVWLTDAEFADFSGQVEFSSAATPSLRFGTLAATDPAARTSSDCTLPASAAGAAGGSLRLERVGTRLSLTLAGASSECTLGSARIPVAVCASPLGATRITLFSITRSG